MLEREQKVERGALVFCNWLVFGLIGIGFLLEGGTRDSLLIGLIGIAGVAAGFVGHIIVNSIFKQSFTLGETSLGLGVFAVFAMVFATSWLGGGLSSAGLSIGLILLSVLVIGFLVYVITRYGVRGAFERFDVTSVVRSERQE